MKNNRILILVLFLLLIGAQWFVVIDMIEQQQKVINTGTLFRFKTQPIDPNDPFRGKYVFLNFESNTININKEASFAYNDEVYVSFTEDENHFAKISKISNVPPQNHSDYLKTKINGVNSFDSLTQSISVHYPFNRFYMHEKKAPEAERVYIEANRDTIKNNSYAEVYIKNGIGVLTDVKINDVSLRVLSEKN